MVETKFRSTIDPPDKAAVFASTPAIGSSPRAMLLGHEYRCSVARVRKGRGRGHGVFWISVEILNITKNVLADFFVICTVCENSGEGSCATVRPGSFGQVAWTSRASLISWTRARRTEACVLTNAVEVSGGLS